MIRRLLLALALAGCRTPATPPPVAAPAPAVDPERLPFDEAARVAELRTVLAALRDDYSHVETKQQQWGVDLDALAAKYEPAFRRAATWSQYERAMVALVAEFHDAHLQWRRARGPSEHKRRIVRLGLATRFVGDDLVVSSVWPGSGAERAGVKPGDRIVSVDGESIAQAMAGLARLRSWSRTEDARYDFAEEWPAARIDADAPPPTRTIERLRDDGTREALTVAPETQPPPGWRKEAVAIEHVGGAAVIRVRSLLPHVDDMERRLDAALAARADDARGLVLDLRGNNGGYDGNARAIAARFAARPIVGGTLRVRLSTTARAAHAEWRALAEDPQRPGWSLPQPVRAEPARPKPAADKLAVLVDAGCRSSCESLSLLLRAAGARLFGETTGGSSGAPVTVPLATSKSRLTIPAWAMFDLNDKPIEGQGVTPDEIVTFNRDDLINGNDPVLKKAIDWLSH